MIYAMGFQIQKMRIILTLFEPKYFKESFFNLKKKNAFMGSNKWLNATLRQNLPLKGNCDLASKMCYL